MRPGRQDVRHQLLGLVHREDEHLGLRHPGADLAGGRKAVEAGHHRVQDGDVGAPFLRSRDRLVACRRLAAHLQPCE